MMSGVHFPLCLSLTKPQFAVFERHQNFFTYLRRSSQVAELTLSEIDPQDTSGIALIFIQDSQAEKVKHCLVSLLDKLHRELLQDTLELGILVPARLISQDLARPDNFLDKIRRSIAIQIQCIVHPPEDTNLMVAGSLSSVKAAIFEVYSTLRQKHRGRLASVKFIIASTWAGFIIGRHGLFFKDLRETFNVEAKVYKADGPPCSETESILVTFTQSMRGELAKVNEALLTLTNKIVEARTLIERQDLCESRMLIPSHLALRVIGVSGSTIQEITRQAAGSSINILLTKHVDADKMIEAQIRGPVGARVKAAQLILQTLNDPKTTDSKSQTRRSRSRSRSWSRSSKTAISFAVPEAFIERLIEKGGDKALETHCRCSLSLQSDLKIKSSKGLSKLCVLAGEADDIAVGVRLLLEQIQVWESS
jgi:hypothetical protein